MLGSSARRPIRLAVPSARWHIRGLAGDFLAATFHGRRLPEDRTVCSVLGAGQPRSDTTPPNMPT